MQSFDDIVHCHVWGGASHYFGFLKSAGLENEFNYCCCLPSSWRSMDHRHVLRSQAAINSFLLRLVEPMIEKFMIQKFRSILLLELRLIEHDRVFFLEQNIKHPLIQSISCQIDLLNVLQSCVASLVRHLIGKHSQVERLLKIFEVMHFIEGYHYFIIVHFVDDAICRIRFLWFGGVWLINTHDIAWGEPPYFRHAVILVLLLETFLQFWPLSIQV